MVASPWSDPLTYRGHTHLAWLYLLSVAILTWRGYTYLAWLYLLGAILGSGMIAFTAIPGCCGLFAGRSLGLKPSP